MFQNLWKYCIGRAKRFKSVECEQLESKSSGMNLQGNQTILDHDKSLTHSHNNTQLRVNTFILTYTHTHAHTDTCPYIHRNTPVQIAY